MTEIERILRNASDWELAQLHGRGMALPRVLDCRAREWIRAQVREDVPRLPRIVVRCEINHERQARRRARQRGYDEARRERRRLATRVMAA